MKKIIIPLIFLVFAACSKESQEKHKSNSSLLLLRVNFITQKFEGGYELKLNALNQSDTLPINVIYQSPGDIGNISLYYKPSNQLFFDGSIIWAGEGKIKIPTAFAAPETYKKTNNPIAQPANSRFENIFVYQGQKLSDYIRIWDAIDDLEIVADYLKSGKNIGIFLYTPGVAEGDPNKWDWFVILNR